VIAAILFTIATSRCTPIPSSPQQGPTRPATQALDPASLHSSTQSPLPRTSPRPGRQTATPDPAKWCLPSVPALPGITSASPINPGLHIAYFAPSGNSYALVLSSPWGEVERTIQLPEGASPPWPDSASGISPDGTFFAYFSPWPSEGRPSAATIHPELSLHIGRIADGRVIAVIPLLSPDFPDNFRRSAEAYRSHPPAGYEDATPGELEQLFRDAFLYGIRSVAWSPDGQALAFAGEADGPSSDVYTYDVLTGAIRRLSDGPEQIVRIVWSPDGAWIAHASATWVGVGTFVTNHAVAADGSRITTFPFGGQYQLGWLTPTTYLVGDSAAALGTRALSILDIEAGTENAIWDEQYYNVAIGDSGSKLLVSSIGAASGNPPDGLYLIDAHDSTFTRLLPRDDWRLTSWGSGSYDFLISDEMAGLAGVAHDGSITKLLDGAWSMEPSPDRTAIALYGNSDMPGLYWTDSSWAEPRILSAQDANWAQWSPDSSLVLISHGTMDSGITLTAVPLTGDPARLIYAQPPGMCFNPSPSWILIPN